MIEYIILTYKSEGANDVATGQSSNREAHNHECMVFGEHGQSGESHVEKDIVSSNQTDDISSILGHNNVLGSGGSGDITSSTPLEEPIRIRHADWAKAVEAATQRRTEVLMPENLEKMWAIGRNYKRKLQKSAPGIRAHEVTGSMSGSLDKKNSLIEFPKHKPETFTGSGDKAIMQQPPRPPHSTQSSDLSIDVLRRSYEVNDDEFPKGSSTPHEQENVAAIASHENRSKLKRSSSTSDLKIAPIINEYYAADVEKRNLHSTMSSSDTVLRLEEHTPKLWCRVRL